MGQRLALSAEDNANRGLNSSRYPAKTEFDNYFIHMDYYQNNDLITKKSRKDVSETRIFFENLLLLFLQFAGVSKDAISTSGKLLFASVTS